MKVGIIGSGAVGTACAKSMLLRGTCAEIVLLDLNEQRCRGVVNDLSHGEPLCSATRIIAGAYEDLSGADVIAITAGINEQAGRAVDRSDKLGRLRLLPHNATVYADIVPRLAKVAPDVPIIVVTDPPDALADLTRRFTATNPILSTGTFLDSIRFRVQIGTRLDIHPKSVDALVFGEHGTSQVYAWSCVRIGDSLLADRISKMGLDAASFRSEVENAVRFANISIIEGTGASQHGIGIVTARIVEAILKDEKYVAPVGTYHPTYKVTLSLPTIIGNRGSLGILQPQLSTDELVALDASAKAISEALASLS